MQGLSVEPQDTLDGRPEDPFVQDSICDVGIGEVGVVFFQSGSVWMPKDDSLASENDRINVELRMVDFLFDV